jgi:hypothetical protein
MTLVMNPVSRGTAAAPVSPNLVLDFAGTEGVDPRIAFTRSTTATRVNSDGLIESVAIDAPRIDYDPVTLQCRGLLCEAQSTNFCLYNRDLTNAAWIKTNCTAARTQTGADGAANSASLLTANANNATCLQSVTLASSARAQTAYIKRAAGSGAVFMTMDNGATWTDISASINGSSFSRCSIPSQTLANPVFGFKLATSGDSIIVDYVQNENGTIATSAIPTTDTAITRSTDAAVMSGVDFSNWYKQDEGTFVVRASSYAADALRGVMSVDDATSNNRMQLRRNAPNQASFLALAAGVVSANAAASVWTDANTHGFALAYRANDLTLHFDGSLTLSDVSVTLPVVTQIVLGGGAAISQLNGHIARIAYYPKRLSNLRLQALSAP